MPRNTDEKGRLTPAKSRIAVIMRGRSKRAETKALAKGSSELHNDQRQMWGSRSALNSFKAKYGGPRNLKAESRSFASGKREINRLRAQGK